MNECLSDALTIISVVLGVVSIILSLYSIISGIKSVKRAEEIHNDAMKMMDDMKFMTVQQIKLSNELEKELIAQKRGSNIICLNKDEIQLHKLSIFDKKHVDKIIEEIEKLSIKKVFLKKIKDFLEGDESNYECNFWGKVQGSDEINISKLYSILLGYNVLMIIKYH